MCVYMTFARPALKRSLSLLLDHILLGNGVQSINTAPPITFWQMQLKDWHRFCLVKKPLKTLADERVGSKCEAAALTVSLWLCSHTNHQPETFSKAQTPIHPFS